MNDVLSSGANDQRRPLVQGAIRLKSAEEAIIDVLTLTGEFWTAKQRQASPLHESAYRAWFKPQLPRFFMERLSKPGDRVYDPFMGRGTTLLEAALLGRKPLGGDINPLSTLLIRPRLNPPTQVQVEQRLAEICWSDHDEFPDRFSECERTEFKGCQR